MAYTPNAADATQPTDAISAETAQAEFRALKAYIQGLMIASGTRIPKRQTVLAGPVDANGISATIAASATALGVDLKATSSPQGLVATWANGFNASGEQDSIQVISNDLANYWASLPINTTSYLAADYVNGVNLTTVTGGPYVAGTTNLTVADATKLQVNNNYSFALTPAGALQSVVSAINVGTNTITLATPVPGGSSIATGTNVVGLNPTAVATKAPPQYGLAYDRTKQAVLQFGGAAGATVFLDDFGNTWTAVGGAKVQTNQFKFGTGGLGGAGAANALNGAADAIKCTNINTLGSGSWALRAWCNPSALPGASGFGTVISMENSTAAAGARLGIFNNAGTIKFAYALSSDGATLNIASNVQGTTTPVVGTWYFIELTYDSLTGVYRLYVNGAQEQSTASALRVCGGSTSALVCGSNAFSNNFFNGYIDKPEFLPYCDHPNGTAYAVPTAASSVIAAGYASDWFDIANMQLRSVSAASVAAATNPTFTQKNRLYVGEADTSGVAVTAVRPYAINGKYVAAWTTPLPGINTLTSKNDNMGTDFKLAKLQVQSLTTDAAGANTNAPPGTIFDELCGLDNTADARMPPIPLYKTRNTVSFQTGNAAAFLTYNNAGAGVGFTLANWQYRIISERAF